MKTLSLDLETYSDVDLQKSGVYAYTASPNFEILLLAYAYDDKGVQIIDLANGEKISDEIIKALMDETVIKTAFNAQFERTCLSKHLKTYLQPEQWRCSMVHALSLGLPGSLKEVAKTLNLKNQKMDEGNSLIKYFSVPCKPSKANEGRIRNLPHHDINKWGIFKTYCKQDVEVEREIRKKLHKNPMVEKELKLWFLDQKINDDGIKVEERLVDNALVCDNDHQKKLLMEAVNLTGLDNPNSPMQLKIWLQEKHNIKLESLTKEAVEELLSEVKNAEVLNLLKLRQEMSKTSVKKYEAMSRVMCKDGRVRGLLKFYGASTGRWAGRIINPQNLPRNNMTDLELARVLLLNQQYDLIELLFDSVPDVLSQLIRTAFIPSDNSRFIVADFSAIEARVIAWLAGEGWVIETFKGHGKIYEMTASKMFGVPIEKIIKGNPEYELRAKGKIAVLACGFQGGKGALISMGAMKMGLSEDELQGIVDSWRKANPYIVKLWRDVENAAITAIREKTLINIQHGIKFQGKNGLLFIGLPSGRSLAYIRPLIEKDEMFNKDKITYEGIEKGKWTRIDTYGGKLTENIVQAIARDCLAEAMIELESKGYRIVFHVHDEVILDVPKEKGSLDEVKEIMSEPIDWAKGLPLRADGYECDYYRKD